MDKDRVYSVLVMCMIFLASAFGVVGPTLGCISLYVNVWINKLGLSAAEAGWISAILSLFFYVMGPLYSILIHAIGIWKAQLLAAVISTIGLAGTAFSTQLWQILLAYSVMLGMGCSMSRVISCAAIKKYFKKQAQMFTISMAGMASGFLIGPVMMTYLFKAVEYRYALLIQGGIMLIILVGAAIMFRLEDNLKHENDKYNPTDTILKVIMFYSVLIAGSSLHQSMVGRKAGSSPEESELTTWQVLKREVGAQLEMLKDVWYILPLISYLLCGMGTSTVFTYIVENANQSGYATSTEGAFGMTIFGIAVLIASLSLIALMKFNKQPVVLQTVTVFIWGVLHASLPLVDTLPVYYAVCFLMGFNESILSSNFMSHAQTFGDDMLDTRVAQIVAVGGIGYFIGPIVSGLLIEPLGLTNIFYLAGGLSAVGAILTTPSSIKSVIKGVQERNREKTTKIKTDSPQVNGDVEVSLSATCQDENRLKKTDCTN